VEEDPEVAASLGYVYANAGQAEPAQAILERLKKLAQQRYVSPLYMAIIATGLKNNDTAIEYLSSAFNNRHPGLVLIRVDPLFDDLRSDERFKELVKKFEPMP
jgi:Tfp pilus assembly protein PilF